MKKVRILRHTAENYLGHFTRVLEAMRLSYSYIEIYENKGTPLFLEEDTLGLVILGGPQHVYQPEQHPFLIPEIQLIQEAIHRKLPVFGICLGAQLLASSLGARVEKSPVVEIGWTPIYLTSAGVSDPVLSLLGEKTSQFQWHNDTFQLPNQAIHLAQNHDCAHQAFRVGEAIYGVQFHPEVTSSMIQEWLQTSKSLSASQTQAIWEETQQLYEQRKILSQAMFSKFCELMNG